MKILRFLALALLTSCFTAAQVTIPPTDISPRTGTGSAVLSGSPTLTGNVTVTGNVLPTGAPYNVRAYGAVGNGTTDDTAALQAAFTAANAAGKSVLLPQGNYKITSGLTFSGQAFVKLYGEKGTTITYAGSDTSVKVLTITDCYACVFEGFNITYSNNAAVGIWLKKTTGLMAYNLFNHVNIDGVSGKVGIGVRIGGTGSTDANNDFHQFNQCEIANYSDTGVSIEATQAYNILFTNARVGSGGHGNYGISTYSGGGTFAVYGGAVSGNLQGDFRIGQPNGGTIIIDGINSEGSGRLLVTGGPANNVQIVKLSNIRWAGDSIQSDHRIIQWDYAGVLSIENCNLGAGANTLACEIKLNTAYTTGTTLTVTNSYIATTLSNPFTGIQPTFVNGLSLDNNSTLAFYAPTSTSTSTGTEVIRGGLGVAKAVHIGGAADEVQFTVHSNSTQSSYPMHIMQPSGTAGLDIHSLGISLPAVAANDLSINNVSNNNIVLSTNNVERWRTGANGSISTVPIIAPAATTSIPSIRLPHGAAPSSPTNGDLWTTSAGGLYVQINGATVGPLGTGGSGGNTSSIVTQVAGNVTVGAGGTNITSSNMTWNATNNTLTVPVIATTTINTTDINITNQIAVPSGGTNLTAATQYGVIMGNNTGAFNVSAQGTAGQAFISAGAGFGAYGALNLTGGSNVTGTLPSANIVTALTSHTYEGLTISTTNGTFTLANSTTLNVTGGVQGNIVVSAATYTMPEADTFIGDRDIKQNPQTGDYTVVITDLGKHIYHASGAAANTYTIPANATISRIGATVSFVNYSANNTTISLTTDTLRFYNGTAVTTGNRTLITGGVATALKTGAAEWTISGNGALQ